MAVASECEMISRNRRSWLVCQNDWTRRLPVPRTPSLLAHSRPRARVRALASRVPLASTRPRDMADERSEAQLASAATWAGGATSENADREASWRRRSVDSKIERTTSIAAVRDAPTTGARVATRRVESGRDDAGVRTHEPPPAGTRRAFDPPLAVEVSDLSLWVRPAFGGGTKPRAPFGVPFGARAPGAKRGDARSARTHQRVPPLDVEKAEGTVRGGRALPLGEEGSSSEEERRREEKMVRVLRGVSFEALPGETTANLGPSGSG